MENEQADARLKPSRETKFSGAKGEREMLILPVPGSAGHERDWESYYLSPKREDSFFKFRYLYLVLLCL